MTGLRVLRRSRLGRAISAAAVLCASAVAGSIAHAQPPVPNGSFPVASAIRLAGDARQTRIIVDFDRKISLRAFTLADPYRVVLDMPQTTFAMGPESPTQQQRGLVKAYRYGLVMAGGSRMVIDLTDPAKISRAEVLEPVNGQPARLVLELDATDRAGFLQAIAARNRSAGDSTGSSKAAAPAAGPALSVDTRASDEPATASGGDSRPVVVIDPGHGGIDNGTRGPSGEEEKEIVLNFAHRLRDQLAKSGKYRIVMTREDDTFIPLGERVRFARDRKAALFISVHADALPKHEGHAQGATIYTLSDKASDAEAARLADSENKADAIAGLDLREEPSEVADILIDLVQRETKTFSNRFAGMLVRHMRGATRLHQNPLKSAGFRVLKAHDVPSVLVELGYVSDRDDLKAMQSDKWRDRTAEAMAQAVDTFFSRRLAGASN